MRLPFTPAFAEESARLALRFCCEECGYFDGATERCRHDWPTELHRRRATESSTCREVVFCKEFELC